MSRVSSPNLKHTLVAFVKLGYHEMTTIIALSAVFWIVSVPIITIGPAVFALFDVFGSIYSDGDPKGEVSRLKHFFRSFRADFRRGIPLSMIGLFIFANTYWYFAIVISGQATYYIIGGLVGLYACLLVVLFVFRMANQMSHDQIHWTSAVCLSLRSWIEHPDYTILQVSIVVIPLIASIAFPAILLFLFPGSLALLELTSYDELTGTDPRTVLARYDTPT